MKKSFPYLPFAASITTCHQYTLTYLSRFLVRILSGVALSGESGLRPSSFTYLQNSLAIIGDTGRDRDLIERLNFDSFPLTCNFNSLILMTSIHKEISRTTTAIRFLLKARGFSVLQYLRLSVSPLEGEV
jgi:hypothetical protein